MISSTPPKIRASEAGPRERTPKAQNSAGTDTDTPAQPKPAWVLGLSALRGRAAPKTVSNTGAQIPFTPTESYENTRSDVDTPTPPPSSSNEESPVMLAALDHNTLRHPTVQDHQWQPEADDATESVDNHDTALDSATSASSTVATPSATRQTPDATPNSLGTVATVTVTVTSPAKATPPSQFTPAPTAYLQEMVLEGKTFWVLVDPATEALSKPAITLSGSSSWREFHEYNTYKSRPPPPPTPEIPWPTRTRRTISIFDGHPSQHSTDDPHVTTMSTAEPSLITPTLTTTTTETPWPTGPACPNITPYLMASAHMSPLERIAPTPEPFTLMTPVSATWDMLGRFPLLGLIALVLLIKFFTRSRFCDFPLPWWKLPPKFMRINAMSSSPIQCMRCFAHFTHEQQYEVQVHAYEHAMARYEEKVKEYHAAQNKPVLSGKEAPHPRRGVRSAYDEYVTQSMEAAYKQGIKMAMQVDLDRPIRDRAVEREKMYDYIDIIYDGTAAEPDQTNWDEFDYPPPPFSPPTPPPPRPKSVLRRVTDFILDTFASSAGVKCLSMYARESGKGAALEVLMLYVVMFAVAYFKKLPLPPIEGLLSTCARALPIELFEWFAHLAWAGTQSLLPRPPRVKTYEEREAARLKEMDEVAKRLMPKKAYPTDYPRAWRKKQAADMKWDQLALTYPGRTEAKEAEIAAAAYAPEERRVKFEGMPEYKWWEHTAGRCGGAQRCRQCAEKKADEAAALAHRKRNPQPLTQPRIVYN